jgi:hypothetical protein
VYRTGDRAEGLGAGVLLSLPTDRWLVQARKAKRAPPVASSARPSRPARVGRLPGPRLRADDARALVAQVHHVAGLAREHGRLDGLASRARWSALLPHLRVRATQLLDESSSLSPTAYDPNRTTASGGASLWLEGRASWSLDRLVFATEEVRLERLRQQIAARRARLQGHALQLLFEWQRAVARLADPWLDPAECLAHELSAQQRSIELDVLTAGWFGRYRRSRRRLHATARCAIDLGDQPPPSASADSAE